MKKILSVTLTFLVVLFSLGCTTSYKHVLVSVVDSRTRNPVQGATVTVSFLPKTRTVTDRDGMALIKLRSDVAQDALFEVAITNELYEQDYGSETDSEWFRRPDFVIPTKPDIVLGIVTRADQKHAEEKEKAKAALTDQAAEKLLLDSPDFWPVVKDDSYPTPNDVGRVLLSKRWERASTNELGSKEDVESICAAVLRHMKNSQAKVGEIRWISPTVAMVKSSWYASPLAGAGYTYALQKKDQGWTVIAYYMDYIS